MASGIFVGSVYATMELQTGGFTQDIARSQAALQAFDKAGQNIAKSSGNWLGQANTHFNSIADGISGLVKGVVALGVTGSIGLGAFVKTAGELQTTSRQMEVLIGNTDAANKVFGELYNYTLGKPIAFPDASKAAKTLLGYGRSSQVVMKDMEALSAMSIVNGADLQALSLVFGQVTSRGALFGQDALQLINNNIPLTTILARKFGISMEEAAEKINGGKVSAAEFTEAMYDYAKSLDISKFSDTFENRMLSLRGSLRSFGLTILGLKIDPIKGLMIESGGLFDRISQGIAQIGPMLKQVAPLVKGAFDWLFDNGQTVVALVAALGAAFVAAKVGAFATSIMQVAGGFLVLAGRIGTTTAAQWGLNTAMTANPVGAIVVAFVAVAAALTFLQVKFNIFGKAFEAIKPIVNTVKKAFTDFWNAIKPIRDFIGKQLTDAFKALQSIGKQLAESFKHVIDTLKQILANKTVQTVLKGIGIALLAIVAAPVVAFFAAVIAVITVVSKVLQFVAKHFETIKKVVLTVMAIALAPLIVIIGAIVLAVKAVIAIVKNWGKITSAVGKVFSTVGDVIKGAFDGVIGVFKTIGSVVASVFNTIAGVITGVFNVIMTIYNATLKPVLDGIIYIVKAIGTVFFTIFSGIVQVVYTVVSTIVQIIGVVLYGIVSFIWTNILVPIGQFFANVWNAIYNTVATVVGKVWGVISSVFNTVKGFISSVWNAIYGTVSSVLSSIWNTVTTIFNNVKNTVSSIFNSIKSTVSSIWNSISSTIRSIASGIWNSITGTFNNIKNTVVNAVTGAYNGVKNLVSNFVNAGKDLIDGIVRGITNAKDAVVNKIKDICSGALDAVKSFFGIKSPSRVMAQMGTYLMEGFGIGIEDESKSVARTMYNAAQQTQDAFNPQLKGVVDYSRIAPNGMLPSLANQLGNRTTQLYGDINIASNVDADAFLTQAGLVREGELTERGMATS